MRHLALAFLLASAAYAQTPNTDPPAAPVKLIFVHHSTGENWLRDDNGGLALALMAARYHVSDTNYEWGPADADLGEGMIGDHTDIGNWWQWFAGPHRDTYLAALFAENEAHSEYTRMESDPGGANRVVLIKSCFPNAGLSGPASPIPSIDDNPLRGQDASSEAMTVANAKGIYVEVLKYFATRPDVLFVVVVNPPLGSFDTDAAAAANARALADWLTNDWLAGYSGRNVFVFDFFNVLTSNGGSSRTDDPSTNDLGSTDGNHHRLWNGTWQHLQSVSNNMSAYAEGGDSHPTSAGNLKATGEFVPLLNAAWHCWQGSGGCPAAATGVCQISSCAANVSASSAPGQEVAFTASIVGSAECVPVTYDWDFGDSSAHATTQSSRHVYTTAGTYAWSVTMSAGGKSCMGSGTIAVMSGGGRRRAVRIGR